MVETFIFLYNKDGCDSMEQIKSKEYEVTIEKQDHFGNGIARVDGKLVFVKGALPEERIKIEITKVQKKFMNAIIKEIKKSSKIRKNAQCPYYKLCGGCQMMEQDYQSQITFKKQKVDELLKKYAGIDTSKIKIIESKESFHYRNKVTFHGQGKKFGFYQEKSHSLIPIDACILVEKEINIIYQKILDFLSHSKNSNIDKIIIRKTSRSELMVIFEGKVKERTNLIKELQSFPVHSIFLNHQRIYGKEAILEQIFNFQFYILKDAFFQVNYQMMKKLYQIVIDYYREKNYSSILDLYCGTGTIGILITPYVKKVIGIEVVEDSIIAANRNKEQNQIQNIDFILGKVEDKITEFQGIDSMILDPPRKGLDKKTLQSILKILPKSIVYISCDPVTLSRDLKFLQTHYTLLDIHLVDMFPNTYHVESVCILNRR